MTRDLPSRPTIRSSLPAMAQRTTVPASRWDCVVIGGGVNGTGTLRDLAQRGLRVLLLEKDDYGAGTSGASSGMIHGGLRYMLSDPSLVRATCFDSGRIYNVAKHLTFRIPFIVPVNGSGLRARVMLSGMEAAFTAYDMYATAKHGRKHVLLTPQEALKVEPGLSPDMAGAVTFDEWGIDVFRLCIANVLSAEESGGKAQNHTLVESIQHREKTEQDEAHFALKVRYPLQGNRPDVLTCRSIVNAAGPWGPEVARRAGVDYRLRPSRGVHVIFDRRIVNYAIGSRAVDGRTVYLEPWQNVTIAGCTDDDYYGDPDDAPVNHDDVMYLLQGIASVFPSVMQHRVIGTWVGVRPTLFDYGPVEEDLSRAHRIYSHREQGLPGMYSIAGGKLAAYRQISEEAADRVEGHLGRSTRCQTGERPLPGSEEEVQLDALARHYSVSPVLISRLVYRHGCRARDILSGMLRAPSRRAPVCRCEPVTAAEIRYVVRYEHARTLDDVMHRTRLGTGPCGGVSCSMRAASILGEELGWHPREMVQEARRFVRARYATRRPALAGDQARQEMLNLEQVARWR